MQPSTKGFTLIELLVVIAIIGTISAVVLAAITVARNKGVDAAIRLDLDSARPQGELFYDANNNMYVVTSGTASDVCNESALAGTVRGVYPSVFSAAQAMSIGSVSFNAAPSVSTAVCNSTTGSTGGWAVQVPLKLVPGTYYCVDSVGTATTTDTGLVNGSDVTCL